MEFGLHLRMVEILLDARTVRGAVKVETTEAGRTRWTTGLAEPWVETTGTGRRPGGDHSVGRAKWSHRSW